MTRLTRSPPGPPQWSSGGWLNTTMSPSRTSCQLKNAFWTRTRSYTPSVGTMDDEGIQKVWNTNARARPASSTATRIVTTVSISGRLHRRRRGGLASAGAASAGPVPAGPASAGSVMPGFPDDHLLVGGGGGRGGGRGGGGGGAARPH